MAKIYITRRIPEVGIGLLENAGHEVIVSEKDPEKLRLGASGVLTHEELVAELKNHNPDAVLCLLTDKIDSEIFDAAPNAKVFASYSVGFGHIDLDAAKERGVVVTNTPGVLTDSVAEYAAGMICAITKRIPEADMYAKAGNYKGWAPTLLLGNDLKGKTLGVLGAGRIGSRVAEIMNKGFDMEISYYDIKENESLDKNLSAKFYDNVDDVLRIADIVTIHVPLLDSTRGMINAEKLSMMKSSAYLVNTSRGQVVDERALVEALQNNVIKGAALDVFEDEPRLADGLSALDNVILTPHIASATLETRNKMSKMAAENVLAVLSGEEPLNRVV